MKTVKIILIFCFVFLTSNSYADGGFWSDYAPSTFYGSATAAADYACSVLSSTRGALRTQYSNGSATYWCVSGSTVNANFTAAKACTSPQTWNQVTQACAVAVVCTAGQTKTILVAAGTYPPSGAPPTIVLNHDRTSTMEQPITVSQGGCAYTIPLNPKQNTGCSTSSTGIMYCRVQATQTGANVSGADTALDAVLTTDQTPVPSAKVGCILTQSGEEICATTSEKNCGTVNGVQVCVKNQSITSNGLPAAIIDGKVTVGEGTNVNGQAVRCWNSPTGQPICINPPVTGSCGAGTLFTCITPEPTATIPSPPTFGLSHDVQTVTKNTSVTNSDNTLTKTATTTTDVSGSSPYKVQETYSSTGQLLQTVYTGAKLGNGNSVSTAPGDGSDSVDTGAPGTPTITGDLSGIDAVFASGTDSLTTLSSGVNGSKFIQNSVSLPSASTCQTVPMIYKSLHYVFDPCSKLAMFKEMFGYLLYILTVYSIYEIAVRPSVNA